MTKPEVSCDEMDSLDLFSRGVSELELNKLISLFEKALEELHKDLDNADVDDLSLELIDPELRPLAESIAASLGLTKDLVPSVAIRLMKYFTEDLYEKTRSNLDFK